jgi:hypothetical protein
LFQPKHRQNKFERHGGQQILRYAAAGFFEAEKSFRRVKDYRQIPLRISAIEKGLEPSSSTLIAKTA